MGLFSFLHKNKQDTPADEGGYRSRDEAAGALARSKRASNAGAVGSARRGNRETVDPVLPEKKRARRRLVGAIALALAVAVGLPMILDSEPKPLATDIAIQIPSKDKPAASTTSASAPAASAVASAAPVPVDAGLDKSEEVVKDPVKPAPAAQPSAPLSAPAVSELATGGAVAAKPPKAEPAPLPRVEHKAPPKPEPKPEVRAEVKAEPKPVVADTSDADAARALAILEGKPAAKPHDAAPAAGGGRVVLQVAALATQDKVDELQAKLRDAGLHSYAQHKAGANVIRVRVGPFASKDEADKARAKLTRLGLSGTPVAD